MRRNMDVIRDLLLQLEAAETINGFCSVSAYGDDADLRIDGVSSADIDAHMNMLYDAGFIVSGTDVRGPLSGSQWYFQKITWEGRDFLDAVRSPDAWKKTKSITERVGGWTASLLAETAKQVLKAEMRKHGLPLD